MSFTGAYLTILYTVLLHFTFVGTNSLAFNIMDIDSNTAVMFMQGLVFISYPLIGLLADIKLTHYRMICLSCWILLIGHLIILIGCIIGMAGESLKFTYLVSFGLVLILVMVGKGMFESTAIQFGTDQMIEASSAQLSTFIHWYYWSLYVGSFCNNVIAFGVAQYFSQCN